MPFQSGNTYGKNSKLIDMTVRKLVVQDLNSPQPKLVRGITKIIERASEGDIAAMDWVTTRESGKAGSDDENKSQLIQVVINGYADVQARIVDNQPIGHDGVVAVTGGACPVEGVASRVPDDSLPIHEVSELPTPAISEFLANPDVNDPPV